MKKGRCCNGILLLQMYGSLAMIPEPGGLVKVLYFLARCLWTSILGPATCRTPWRVVGYSLVCMGVTIRLRAHLRPVAVYDTKCVSSRIEGSSFTDCTSISA